MKFYFKSILILYLVMALSIACAPSGTPTADLSAYYGEPKAAVLTINGQQQKAGVGTSTWIISKSGDEIGMSHGDAFAMITPDQALVTKSPFTATLSLSIPVAPSQLYYHILATTHLEKYEYPQSGRISWTPSRPADPVENPLPLQQQQDIALDLSPGGYVLVVFVEWADLGDVEYGFWIEVQAETIKAITTLEATVTLAPTPDYDQTATAIVQAVVSTVQPKVHTSLPSPDKNWRVEIIIYDCVQVVEGDTNAYEQLKLIRVSDGTESVMATQLQYCGGVGAYGLGGLYWSPNSRYFYYTDAREGSPDGLCWYWERPIHRLDVLTQETEFIGEGPLSPDKAKIAMWQEGDLVIWGLDEGELARTPAAVTDAKRGPISWSPDSRSLVYIQTMSDCFPFGKSYVIRFDVSEGEQSLLLESKPISFIHVNWETPDRINLSDEQGNQWSYDLVNFKLEPAP